MAFEILQTDIFKAWIAGLRDLRAQLKIVRRIDRAERGNFGDHKSVGDGVSEMRIDEGAGYRVYYVVRGTSVVILLCGGNKSSQDRDIKRAKALAEEV